MILICKRVKNEVRQGFKVKWVKNEAKFIFIYKRVNNETISGFKVQMSQEWRCKGFWGYND